MLKSYRGHFRAVVFAIINDKNSFQEHNPKGNVLPFAETFRLSVTPADEFDAECAKYAAEVPAAGAASAAAAAAGAAAAPL